MTFKKHDRQYDLVVFGATGYTGKFTAEHIATHLPTSLKWAISGRSRDKLEKLVVELKAFNPDRLPPAIEICDLNGEDLGALAKKTFILISTVGPFGTYGEHAFKACAENACHYLDSTGEVPWVFDMIKKYEDVAKANGALMFPQMGVESAPPDLVTWCLASANKKELQAQTKDCTVSIHTLDSAPSGGTLATVFTLFDNFTVSQVRASHVPFALSPIPHPQPSSMKTSLLSKITGVTKIPNLGLLTTSLAGGTDKAIVERSWGVLSATPSRKEEFYGPNFTYKEYMKAKNWLHGLLIHYGLVLFGLTLITPPLRRFVHRFVYQPGEGPSREQAKKDFIEYRGVANPDLDKDTGKQAFCSLQFRGSMYLMTGMLMSQAALTLLEDDVGLEGGIYTASCLGKTFIERLDGAGMKFETKIVPV